MASPRRSTKRRSTKRSTKGATSWIRKLQTWRKAHRHVDGSLPSMKSAMKHCKGRSSRRTKCRKNQGRKPSPKRRSKSPKRKSPKRKSSTKKKSPKKCCKCKSPKRKSSKRKSPKKKSTKKKSTRKPKALSAIASAQRDQMSAFRRFGPRLQQTAALASAKNAPFAGPAKKYQPQQQLSGLFGQALPQGLQNFQQQQGPMFGPQTRQAAQARQARQAAPAAQGGILGMLGL